MFTFKRDALETVEKKKTLEERIVSLESSVGVDEKDEDTFPWRIVLWGNSLPKISIRDDAKATRKDLKELVKKLDALQRYLEIELVTGNEKVETYGWNDNKEVFEFRKARPFDVIKAEKDAKEKAESCCD